MTRTFITVLLYLGSLAAVASTAGLISQVLALYPAGHLATFGPVVPGLSKVHATWLPFAPALLAAVGVLSALIAVVCWRSPWSRDSKTFAGTALAAINYFFALFCATTLLVAYFYLPKVANVA